MATMSVMKAIDDLRDTIVGKIPMPNIQVEQITLALLYKFMDDMDQSSIDFGGNATFFSEEFEKYSWKKIMSNSVGAQTRYNLYTEALEKFYTHPRLPNTFKEIFKNATVPYKDAETLTNFLKIIDSEFDYKDSEQLGDAYEYLLSVLGSQGDLGQFRTPRHIIDFIVDIVNPQKSSTILDPACGTAGFLISAYKKILENNTEKIEGDKLTFDEKSEILKNINGYDIEPSMVRIAEMNLFLHGANEPKIYEYDTLTMDEKWNEKYDYILANPPFMTPKGGIKPHMKFSVKANRSEILFVDYINNHLKSTGKAGIIVPDGVVSTNTVKAFKDVRKDLVENGLVAVVALPRGIFNPYSPIKTSILFIDKKLSKEIDDILFIQLNNDGFSLGTQRTPIAGNEIPKVTKTIKYFLENNTIENEENGFLVKKKDILQESDCNLNYKKYQQVEIIENKIDVKKSFENIEKLDEQANELMNKIRRFL